LKKVMASIRAFLPRPTSLLVSRGTFLQRALATQAAVDQHNKDRKQSFYLQPATPHPKDQVNLVEK
jgi:hypothetical protein